MSKKERKKEIVSFGLADNLFFIAIGTLLVWSLSIAIIGGTYLSFVPQVTLLRSFLAIAILRLIFLNRYTFWFSIGVVAVAGLIVWLDSLS
ncbi:MAG: hypothetical protein FWC67_02860, partial [Defluviitaleaceae bacterium]|nr:hypothetical protein [Defluviitaleaceae bacterium]